MKLVYHENQLLPKLSWCSVIEKNVEVVNIYHGTGVEVHDNFFVEGAWDGEYSLGGFDKASFFMGSGGKILDEARQTLVFSTPHHAHERLYSIKEEDKLVISNSLPFLLYMTDLDLEIKYRGYDEDLNTILEGINKYKKHIPLIKNKKVGLHYYCDIFINKDLDIKEKHKDNMKPFDDFDDYYKRMKKVLKLFVDNAQSIDRKHQYGLVTTISKGYDATACAALAKEVGCNTAVTFNSPQKYAVDSGYDIAIKLDYENIVTKDAEEYLTNNSGIEAEFVSSGELGNGIVFSAFEEEFAGKMVFFGERGDQLWDKNKTNTNRELRFIEANVNSSMLENRLRVGYIFLPISLFGISEWPSISKISNSTEMEKFSIGGNYDRPIPRRIIETKGVNRELFGMEKKGAGFNYQYDNLNRIGKRMSEQSFESFLKYYNSNKRKDIKNVFLFIRYYWHTFPQYTNYLFKKIGLPTIFNSKSSSKKLSNPGASSYLFNWGVNETIQKYEKSMIERFWLN